MRNARGRMMLCQLGSLLSLAATAIWSLVVLWFYFFTANVISVSSAIPLMSLSLAFVLVLPFNALRFRWSYIASALPFAGFLVLAAVHLLEASHFAFTVRTVTSIVFALIALSGLFTSLQAYRHGSAREVWKPIVGVTATVAVVAISFVLLSGNPETLRRLRATWTQTRIERKLEKLGSLDERIHFLQEEGGLPTLAVGIVVGEELKWNRTFGEQAGVNPIFNIGSITKSVLATAVMQLVELGLLDLDADVGEYLPFVLRHPTSPAIPITTRMLLTHQSGLSHYTARYASYTLSPKILEWASQEYGGTIYGEITGYNPRPGIEEFLSSYLTEGGEFYSEDVWNARPGSGYSYSTPGYDLLGLIISRVTDMPLEEYLRESLFEPLGMRSTGLELTEAIGRRATPHDYESGILFDARVAIPAYDRQLVGAGGLTSTVHDLSRFMAAHMNGGEVSGVRILSDVTVRDMHLLRVVSTADVGMVGYGYGFNIMREEPWQLYGQSYSFNGSIGHGGKDYGYMSRMFFVPTEAGGYGSIILTNRSDFLDSDMTWFFSTLLTIENLLMQEAAAQHSRVSASDS